MKVKRIVIWIILIIFNNSIFGINNGDEISDSTKGKSGKLNIYFGSVFSTSITNSHGDHRTFDGKIIDATVKGIEINQDWAVGINAQYPLSKTLDIKYDIIYSSAHFPEQKVSLEGFTMTQPKSDFDFLSLSCGPGYRYVGEGVWQNLTPYVFLSLSALLGLASDVNLEPEYGKDGSSLIWGIGLNTQCGVEYRINNFLLFTEYRFEYMYANVDHFRSFTEGLNFMKSSSYLLLGLGFYI